MASQQIKNMHESSVTIFGITMSQTNSNVTRCLNIPPLWSSHFVASMTTSETGLCKARTTVA